MNKAKFLESINKDEVYDSSSEKQAIPELQLKQNIIIAEKQMIDSFEKMIYHYKMYRRFIFQDVVIFECSVLGLFNYIKAMMVDYGIREKDRETYKALLRCEYGEHFSPPVLIGFKNLLLQYLHLLNLTNLFKGGSASFEQKIREQY